MHIHVDRVQDIMGFAATNVRSGHYAWVLCRATVYSDDPMFHKYMEQLAKTYLAPLGIQVDAISHFVVVIHADLSADVYVNDFPLQIEMRSRRPIEAGEGIRLSDIADIRRAVLPTIPINATDKVFCCLKVDWRFGLFFDLTRELDVPRAQLDIGHMYRVLRFYGVYRALEDDPIFDNLLADGWFPFIELLHKYSELVEMYRDRFEFDDRLAAFVARFDKERIRKLAAKWWQKPRFEERRRILEAGLSAYLQGDDHGNVLATKCLYSEAEGIIRRQYFEDIGISGRAPERTEHIIDLAIGTAGDERSLFFPKHFERYLAQYFFKGFNIETGDVPASRNSALHGLLTPGAYTRARALQSVLILDQMYYYLRAGNSVSGGATPDDASVAEDAEPTNTVAE